jgi:hypothetical protein
MAQVANTSKIVWFTFNDGTNWQLYDYGGSLLLASSPLVGPPENSWTNGELLVIRKNTFTLGGVDGTWKYWDTESYRITNGYTSSTQPSNRAMYTKRNGAWSEVAPSVFDSSVTPVANVRVTITAVGAAGGSGAGDGGLSGYAGYPGIMITGNIVIEPGDTLELHIGSGGGSGAGGASAAGGAAGGGDLIGYTGGTGGRSGNEGSSGAGGGGGAATVILKNKNIFLVAGGGGGGGGSGVNSPGRAAANQNQLTGSNAGAAGQDKTSGGEHRGGGGGCKIICTKLYELGLMSEDIYLADQAFGNELIETHPDIYNGYRAWAEIVVDWMDGGGPKMMPWMSDAEFSVAAKRWSITWAEDIATPWAEEMAYKMGVKETGSLTGKMITLAGLPICKAVGVWQRIFGPSKKSAGFIKGAMLVPVFVMFKVVAELGRLIERKNKKELGE